MQRYLRLLLLPVLICSGPIVGAAWADEAPKAEDPAKSESPAKTDQTAKARADHGRQTWEQRFGQANAAHDGHLTREEAKSGFPLVAKHFDDIDADHKGYVTENDIRAWRVMRKAARKLAHPPPDKLKPQHAFQRRLPDQHSAAPEQRTSIGTESEALG